MSVNDPYGVSIQSIVFKSILDELVVAIPAAKRRTIYKKHCRTVEKRNVEKARMIKSKGGSKKEYSEKTMKEKDYIKFHVLFKLLETEYSAFVEDCTLAEVGYILGITRERVRQVEAQGIMKIKNPNLLKRLNEKNAIETVMEYKEIAIQRRNKKINEKGKS